MNWEHFLLTLRAYPSGTHNLRPPCPELRIFAAQSQLGAIPDALANLLRSFNGAELFIKACPLITIFAISEDPPLSAVEWGTDWYVEKATQRWRSSGAGRTEWAIAIRNYGMLTLMEPSGNIKEWDTAEGKWSGATQSFYKWIEGIVREGDAMLTELQ